jgi:hypothetical protein
MYLEGYWQYNPSLRYEHLGSSFEVAIAGGLSISLKGNQIYRNHIHPARVNRA